MAEKSITNTFEKGLHQDSSFVYQPNGTYRNIKNGMLISHDGNHYSVEIAKGNKVILTLVPRYTEDENAFDVVPMPIGFVSFIDKLIVFSTNNDTTSGGYGEIGVVEFSKLGESFTATYTPYYHHPELLFTKYHKIEGFSFRENDKIERVYWTDNFNEPRVFDIANPIFTNYFTPGAGNPLVVGEQYMVLKGVIEHPVGSGDFYGPTDASGAILSNIFTAASTSYTETTGASTTSVIEYYDIKLLDWTPSRNLGNIKFNSYGSGSKNCGKSIYFFRLVNNTDGIQTSWSYASSPIHIARSTNSQGAHNASTNGYHNFAGDGSISTLVNSGKSVKIDITNIDTVFDTIELAAADFFQEDEVPYSLSIVNRSAITATEMTLEDLGSVNLGTLTINDITLFPASILTVKTLTTDKNFNLIANTTERQEFELDVTGVTISSVDYPLLAHADLEACANDITYNVGGLVLSTNPAAVGGIAPWTRYLVTDDSGGAITYNGNTYSQGEVFVGVATTADVTIPVGSECRPCTTRNRYTTMGGDRVEDAIEIKTGFWDYKDPAVASHNQGYWSSEKYRFGVLFFDKKGNPFYVKWIGDYSMPDISTKNGLLFEEVTATFGTQYVLRPSGVNISGLDLPQSVVDMISGFSIVRAERDPRIITQGLSMQLSLSNGVYNLDGVNPVGSLDITEGLGTPYESNYLTYMCPDHLSNTPLDPAWNNEGAYMEEAGWLRPYDYSNRPTPGIVLNTFVSSSIDPSVTESKLFVAQQHDPATSGTGNGGADMRKQKIEKISGVVLKMYDEDELDTDFDGGNFRNRIGIGTAVDVDVATCAGGAAPAFLPRSVSTGCKKIVFKLDAMFNRYGFAGSYTASNQVPEKILLNYVKNISPDAQYGGDEESAIANTLYISTGHFQVIDAATLTNTANGTFSGGIYDGENKYTFNEIEIFGGDCFTSIIDIVYGTLNTGIVVGGGTPAFPFAYTLFFPCESNSNYNLRRGRTGARQGTSNGGATVYSNGVVFNDGVGGTRFEDYSYNEAYSTEGSFVKYPALPVGYKFSGKFEYRTRFAGEKQPGELIDTFRRFLIADYKDLDGKLGEINNIKSKDGRVIVWQNHGTSSVPVLERQLLSSTTGAATTIGTGGVVDRFDPITSFYGNQHQHGLTNTEYGYFWFDMRERALCIMGTGVDIQEISLVKGLQVFFNSEFNNGDVSGLAPSDIYNTNNSDLPEIPLMGFGIVGVYDPKFKMSYLTFKYRKDLLVDEDDELVSLTARDFTIGYSHVLNVIVGFYDFTPAIWHNHNDLVLSANNAKCRKYFGENMAETDFFVGDTIEFISPDDVSDNGEYVCIADLTVTEYPPPDIKMPAYPSSNYWARTNTQNEIYLQTFDTQYLKFYGQVYNHELEIIVNPQTDISFSAQHIQVKGNSVNYTQVEASDDVKSGIDRNIRSTSLHYRFIDGSWFSSLPLPTRKGRITDYYAKIKMTYKGYVTDPTTSKNVNKFVSWIKTFFTPKR